MFTYCKNNHVNNIDPDGLFAVNLIGAIVGAGLGGLLGKALANYYGLKGGYRYAVISGFAIGGAILGWFAGPVVQRLLYSIIATATGLTGRVLRAMEELSKQPNKVHHIINGSKTTDHFWERLVPDKGWEGISKIVTRVLLYGQQSSYGGTPDVFVKTLKVSGRIVQVTYRIINGAIKISDGWVK